MDGSASALERTARDLLARADGQPAEVVDVAAGLSADALQHGDLRAASVAHRAAGLAWRALDDVVASKGSFDAAVEWARAAGEPALEAEARTSRAGTMFFLGDVAGALEDVDVAIEVLQGDALALAVMQRATILNRCGRVDEARAGYDRAVDLATAVGATKQVANARSNRGLLHLYEGRLDEADADMRAAAVLYDQLGLTVLAAVVTHNRGLVAGRRGDFVGALDRFQSARQALDALGQGLGGLAISHCEVLLAFGLADEAARRGAETVEELAAAGNHADAAEARLVSALAHLQAGDLGRAAGLAADARSFFEREGMSGWTEAAQLLALRVRAAAGELGREQVAEARELVGRFRSTGQQMASLHAEVLAAQALLACGSHEAALAAVRALCRSGELPVEIRLQCLALEAEALAAGGAADAAGDVVADGAALLESQHVALGACDVRSAVSAHAARLFGVGRRLAWRAGDAAVLFDRVESSRANSLRFRPVRPPGDASAERLLGELRVASAATWSAETIDPAAAERRRSELERAVTELHWGTAGDGTAGRRVATAGDVLGALAGETMLVLAEVDRELVALTAGDGVRAVSLGEARPLVELADGLARELTRLAQRDDGRAARRTEGIGHMAQVLDTRLLGPLGVGGDGVVIVPPARLHRLPWSLLPSLRARPFTVAPSATMWLAARSTAGARSGRAALVAGRGLEHAAHEVARLATIWPSPVVLTGVDATASAVLAGADGVDALHVAAHYTIRRGNPMLSNFELHDGPLFLHDVVRIDRPPSVVVLSACASGVGDVLPADETVGVAGAFLQLGARSVVATTALLPDAAATIDFVAVVHGSIQAGVGASEALALARSGSSFDDPAALAVAGSFLCVGAA